MAYTLGNKCAKNLCKWVVLLQLIIENVVTCFFGTQCSLQLQRADYIYMICFTVVHKNAMLSNSTTVYTLCAKMRLV